MKKHNHVSGFLGLNSQGPVLLKHAGRKSVQDANRHNGRVDGDNFFLSLPAERLLTRGSNIIPANTSSEVMTTLQATQVDAVVLDYHIHDLNRIKLAELIRYREPGMSLFLYAEPTDDPDLDGLFDGIYQKGNRCLDKLIARLTDAKAA
jgi:CheY-like chemotaxis protein